MGGSNSLMVRNSLVLNPQRKYYARLKEALDRDYEDLMWVEDAIFMERNSRTFKPRIGRIDENTEALCDFLRAHPKGNKASMEERRSIEVWCGYNCVHGFTKHSFPLIPL